MKIGIDARPLSTELTGIGIYLKNIFDALQNIDRRNRYYLISNTWINYEIKNKNWVKIEGKLGGRFVSSTWMQLTAPQLARKLRLNLFWGTRHHLPLFLPSRVKTVLTIHDIVHVVCPETMAIYNLILERMLMRCSIRKADYIICDSRSTELGVRKTYGPFNKKIRIIYPGTPNMGPQSSEINGLTEPLPDKYFLFVGTLEPRKNFWRILKAFEAIDPRLHNIYLVVVGGRGWKNKELRRALDHQTLGKYVHLTGYISDDQLRLFYDNALCLLFPSLYEGFGFPILEAMSCGTPVITSNISSMPEVAGEAAILVNPFDVNELKNAMMSILKDVELRKNLSKRGLERVKNFSWDTCARQVLKIFEDTVLT